MKRVSPTLAAVHDTRVLFSEAPPLAFDRLAAGPGPIAERRASP